jgi:CBS domain-containing protein
MMQLDQSWFVWIMAWPRRRPSVINESPKEDTMKVREVMTRNPKFCGPDGTLAEAARIMANVDCGVLPVVDDRARVVGILTDRDVCLAIGSKDRLPSEILVKEIMKPKVLACGAQDDVHTALRTMEKSKVRRLPVLDDDGKLEGILSMDDIVLHAGEIKKRKEDLTYGEAVTTLKAIYRRPPRPKSIVLAP